MVNPVDALRKRQEDLRARSIGAAVYGPVAGTPAPAILNYGGGQTPGHPSYAGSAYGGGGSAMPSPPMPPGIARGRGYGGGNVPAPPVLPSGAYGGGMSPQPPPPMPAGIVAGGGYGGGQTQPGPVPFAGASASGQGPTPTPPVGPMRGWTPADADDRWNDRLNAIGDAYDARMNLYPRRAIQTASDFVPGHPGNESPGYRVASAGGVAPAQPVPAPAYPGGGHVAGTGAGPYSAPPDTYVPPTTLPPQVAAAGAGSAGGVGGSDLRIPPAFTYGDVQRAASAGSNVPPSTAADQPAPGARPAIANSPAKQLVGNQGPGGTLQPNVPLPPARPTAALAPVQAPLPPQRPRTLGMAPTPNAAVPQPPITHVSGPAWLGAFFRAGQQPPTGMSAMVNRPISDLGSGR